VSDTVWNTANGSRCSGRSV